MPNHTILANCNNYRKICQVYRFQNTYMAAYNTYAPTPPQGFHPSMEKPHKRKEAKHIWADE